MTKEYDVDVATGWSQKDYDNGKNIYWDRELSFTSKVEAMKYAKELLNHGGHDGVRVVQVNDPDENPDPIDIFVRFK